MEHPDPWPLRHLVLRTPRLELRPDDDAGLLELVAEAHRGVHPPDEMPFGFAWTDVPAEELGPNLMRFYWRTRGSIGTEEWALTFLVRLDGAVLGSQGLSAKRFAVTRECSTGSWIGMRHQGKGIGTEMRAAVVAFAFDYLGAEQVRSGSWADNPSSLGVSRKLGYAQDGTSRRERRGEPVTEVRLLLTRERFEQHRPDWTLRVDGMDGVREFLGARS